MGHTNPNPLEPPFELRSPVLSSCSSSSPAWPSSTSESSDDETNWLESPSTLHPYSASTKSTRRPKLYEKKSVTLSTPPDSLISSLHATPRPAPRQSGSELAFETPLTSPCTVATDAEGEIWEDALSHAIDFSDGRVDLSNLGLTHIPHNISDLAKLVVIKRPHDASSHPRRLFSRVASAPARSSAPQRGEFGRSATTVFERSNASLPNNASAAEVELYLAGNSIKELPRELFALNNLTVLSLRSNGIEYLPPSVANLVALVELNLSNNKLKYLPAELTQLPRLARLYLSPNPFLPAAGTRTRDIGSLLDMKSSKSRPLRSDVKRTLGPLTRVYPSVPTRVLPLSELCLRMLLSSSQGSSFGGSRPRVWQYYELDEWPIPSPIRKTLLASVDTTSRCDASTKPRNGCNNASSNEKETVDERFLLRAATYYPHYCPNPKHEHSYKTPSISFMESLDLGFATYPSLHPARTPALVHSRVSHKDSPRPPAGPYLRHVEERLEWVKMIAGVKISVNDVCQSVPILWRGCSLGCLQFLESQTQPLQRGPLKNPSMLRLSSLGDSFTENSGDGDGFGEDELDDWAMDVTSS